MVYNSYCRQSTGGYGNQCCYDDNGNLIVGPSSGGTVDKVSPSRSTMGSLQGRYYSIFAMLRRVVQKLLKHIMIGDHLMMAQHIGHLFQVTLFDINQGRL